MEVSKKEILLLLPPNIVPSFLLLSPPLPFQFLVPLNLKQFIFKKK
jgi:hypothetical protein